MTQDVEFSQIKALGIITLNRQAALNALTLPMIRAMQSQLSDWENDSSVHAVIIQAAPGKAFCAGGDVRWIYQMGLEKNPIQLDFFREEYCLNHFIHQFKKPYIALMDGYNFGGGVGISLHGSHRVAGKHFSFAMPETSIGLFPDIGASYLLTRCPGKVGHYLALTGQRLNGEEARQVGLVDYIIENESFSLLIDSLSQLNLAHNAHEQIKSLLNSYTKSQEPTALEKIIPAINYYYDAESVKDILSKLATSQDDWAKENLALLQHKSPISLEVTCQQLNQAVGLSLMQCLKMDYALVQRFMQEHDFYEGVRAMLIDKDKKPCWQPPEIQLIEQSKVKSYFHCEKYALIC